MAADRVQRLKDLTDMLTRLPPSPERDRLLDEVRSRAVDLDTGVTPRAMLPVHEPTPPPVVPRRPERRAPNSPMRAPIQPARPRAAQVPLPTPREPQPVFWSPGLLSLDDSLPGAPADGDPAPWTLGLRG